MTDVDWISRAIGGWNVRMTLRGRRTSRFFADGGHGGKAAALRAAKAHRDELVAGRPPPERPDPRPLVVVRQSQSYVQIRLPKPGGGTTTTEFSARRHGLRQARQLAVNAFVSAHERAAASARAR